MTTQVPPRGHARRTLVALTAAYAIALHAVLLAFVPAFAAGSIIPSGTAPIVSILCAPSGTLPGELPPPHDVPCAALCAALLSGAGALPSAPAVAAIAPADHVVLSFHGGWEPPSSSPRGPHAPRAPPFV